MLGSNPGTVATLASAVRFSDYLGRSREKNCLLELPQSEVKQERYMLKEEGNVDVFIKHVNIRQLQKGVRLPLSIPPPETVFLNF
jgi:hypothetical protein